MRTQNHSLLLESGRIQELSRAVGPLALEKVSIFVADAELSDEDLHIDNPVLKHLAVDIRTVLEWFRDVLNGADCSDGQHKVISEARVTGRHVEVWKNGINTKEKSPTAKRPHLQADGQKTCSRGIHCDIRQDEDPFLDKSLLDSIDSDQHEKVVPAAKKMIQQETESRMDSSSTAKHRLPAFSHANIFRTGPSSGSRAKLVLLKIAIFSNGTPLPVRLRNDSKDQKDFLAGKVSKVVDAGINST